MKRRDAIKICVQPVGGASVSARNVASAKAIDALPGLTRNSNHPAVYTGFPTEVLQGCPQPPALVLEPGHDTEEVRTPTTDPSDIRVFVYVLPQELLDTLSKDWTDRTAAQEMLCLGYSCDEVTTGLYVGGEEVQRPGFLMKALGNALGLSPWAAPDEVLTELGLTR